jgi:hypothetical protein
MSDNININVTENIDQVNIVASEVVEVVDLNLYATTEDVTINVTEEIIQVNINKVTSSNVTKTSDLINDGEDGINPFITLEDIPPIDVSSLVPYTGATQNVDLGEYEIKAGQVEFDQTPTGAAGVGVMRWNDTDGTIDLGLKGGNVTLQVGQENVVRVVNKTATNINLLESNYQAVRVTGAQGQRLKVDLALATNDLLSAETIGLVTETINNNQEGFITTSGLIRGINTTGSLQGETWADGNVLYLSPTTAGRVTNIKPTAPSHLVVIGYVIHAHANQGSIFVKVDNGYELEELHNVTSSNYTTPIDTDSLLTYDVTNSLWKRLSWSNIKSNLKTYFDGIYQTALGFTPENVANKENTTLDTSTTKYPTNRLVKEVTDAKLDKVTTVDVEKVYIKNADGTQGMKATSDLKLKKTYTQHPTSRYTLNSDLTWKGYATDVFFFSAFPTTTYETGTEPTLTTLATQQGIVSSIDSKILKELEFNIFNAPPFEIEIAIYKSDYDNISNSVALNTRKIHGSSLIVGSGSLYKTIKVIKNISDIDDTPSGMVSKWTIYFKNKSAAAGGFLRYNIDWKFE